MSSIFISSVCIQVLHEVPVLCYKYSTFMELGCATRPLPAPIPRQPVPVKRFGPAFIVAPQEKNTPVLKAGPDPTKCLLTVAPLMWPQSWKIVSNESVVVALVPVSARRVFAPRRALICRLPYSYFPLCVRHVRVPLSLAVPPLWATFFPPPFPLKIKRSSPREQARNQLSRPDVYLEAVS